MIDAIGRRSHPARLIDAIEPHINVEAIEGAGTEIQLAHARIIADIRSAGGDVVPIVVTGAGVALEPSEARLKCLHELLENLTGIAPATLRGCVHSFRHGEEGTLNLEHVAPGHSQRANCQHTPPTPPLDLWCDARGAGTGRVYQVPAPAVLPGWSSYSGAGWDFDASGLAAGPVADEEHCLRHGLCEVLERDAMMLCWRIPAWPVCELGDAAELVPTLGRFLNFHGLRGHLLEIGDDALIPVVLCVLSDRHGRVTCGSACGFDLARSSLKSALEAVMLWNVARKHREPPPRQAAEKTYSESIDHVLFGWWNGPAVSGWFDSLPRRGRFAPPNKLSELVERCEDRFFGSEPVVVDLSSQRSEQIGARVCRVIQPHALRKERNELRPFWKGQRLSCFVDTISGLNSQPHPYG